MGTTRGLLTTHDSALLLIDHQPQMLFGVQSCDRTLLVNNVTALAKSAKVFNIPVVLTTIGAKTFGGPLLPEIQAVFPDITPIDRSIINAWDDPRFVEAVKATGRKQLVMAALWTEICLCYPAISAVQAGYDVYAVIDASGGSSLVDHEMAVQRMIQAGVVPITWQPVLFEYQRDWARMDTYQAVMDIVKEHTGAFAAGAFYAQAMFQPSVTAS